ncbi:MAG: hypothetical protein AAF690_18535 [Acidobacteriota bacterium]
MANLTLIDRLQAAAARSLDIGLRQKGTLEKLLGVAEESLRERPERDSGDEPAANDAPNESSER